MRRYTLYGELDFSPISIKSNKLSDILNMIKQLHEHTTIISWYFLCIVYKNGYEEITKKAIIKRECKHVKTENCK